MNTLKMWLLFYIQSCQSDISHSDRAGKRLQDTASGGYNYCTCTVSSDFTASAVELYEHEEKEQWEKITPAKHRCSTFPSSPVMQSTSPSLLLIETGRVSKSQMFLRNNAMIQCLYCSQQLHWMWGYGSWENSHLILQSSMVNRKNIDPHHWQNTEGERNFTKCMLSCFIKERVLLGAVSIPAQTQTNT